MSANEINKTISPDSASERMINGMSPLIIIASITMILAPLLINIDTTNPYYLVWDKLVNPFTQYVFPIIAIIFCWFFVGIPRLTTVIASCASFLTSVILMSIIIFATSGFELGWIWLLASLLVVIFPFSKMAFVYTEHYLLLKSKSSL